MRKLWTIPPADIAATTVRLLAREGLAAAATVAASRLLATTFASGSGIK